MESMNCVAAVVFLSLLSLGRPAPVNNCGSLAKPITLSNEDMLGRWLYIGGSSDLPGSRSLGHLMTSVWLDITATAQSNVLHLIQTQRISGKCTSLTYNVTFENNTMLIDKPFYLKEVYLPTNCSDCLVVYEEIASGKQTFTSLLLFSRRKSIEAVFVEMFETQAECLQMPSPIMTNPDYEICPDNIPPSEGLSALNSLLEAKMGHRVARFLDTIFDMFVN
ncbi:hypothetical protein JOB18_020786 [Solea senegalensis]|uniref:Apolipoprotein M n=1 Tax=Solea senegalensis TaxID=28829 RepID=A0AAV6PHZ2_SOLSE|nr:uncharacterized protein LOC122760337 [Solea senegalensis]KAG7460506.1 hypothetical protein JOB18_020786 [Solea senegalensis]